MDTGIAEIFTSYDLFQHATKTRELAKLWNVSEAEANNKLRRSIKVMPGTEPGLLMFEAKGLDHEIAVKILNELCICPGTLGVTVVTGGGERKVQTTIVQPAK